jgi:hypothetical protein
MGGFVTTAGSLLISFAFIHPVLAKDRFATFIEDSPSATVPLSKLPPALDSNSSLAPRECLNLNVGGQLVNNIVTNDRNANALSNDNVVRTVVDSLKAYGTPSGIMIGSYKIGKARIDLTEEALRAGIKPFMLSESYEAGFVKFFFPIIKSKYSGYAAVGVMVAGVGWLIYDLIEKQRATTSAENELFPVSVRESLGGN